MEKLEAFVREGGNAIVTSGFVIGALKKWPEQLGQLTSVSYTNRTLTADEFQTPGAIAHFKNYVKSAQTIEFPILEHRKNAKWSIIALLS